MINDILTAVTTFFRDNWLKILWLVIVAVLAYILARVLARIMAKGLQKANIPNASLFINVMRIIVVALALTAVLQPIFGINPSTLFTALGIGGLAVSLGLKDVIANIISGFDLMAGKVISPGDVINISGVTGVVEDITWRQTVVRSRSGSVVLIPNSILSTTAVEKIDPSLESLVKVPFTAKSGTDDEMLTQTLLGLVNKDCANVMNPNLSPIVKFTGLTPYGITGEIYAFAKKDVLLSTVMDSVARAIAGCDLLEQRAATGGSDVEASAHISQ
ncbi:mechanosensitive ion channel family protein [Bifidobacterium magnum]|uniref:Mechanosensitive ion channel n=1 Tax=Bifidobacterium magnum TaxID=1692 RepID=A0A087BAY0_9BIFI|nr:mechanosensitive ion channel domain-containing protein [Bifidobacterium magnum]KFI68180.1 Mechanosensitive ion channel [Bifidobacterium magnum]